LKTAFWNRAPSNDIRFILALRKTPSVLVRVRVKVRVKVRIKVRVKVRVRG